MIDIQDKSQCCGCGACAQRCPQSCIVMQEDEKGFLYSKVDTDACINCGLCEQMCPVLNPGEKPGQCDCFAAINPDEKVRLASSSGGVFSILASRVIEDGGAVFGARFDEQWAVVHDCAETLEGIETFRGSKYVQSAIGDSYQRAEQILNQGKTVLFSGTPCQIAGLKRFLRKDFPNLLTVEIACHGVPSPKVWREYLNSRSKGRPISQINFRDKSTGWRNYSVLIGQHAKPHDDDDFMACYLDNYNFRPSCFACPSKMGKSGADLLIADFWGAEAVNGIEHDDKGTSAVIVYSSRGRLFLELCGMDLTAVNVESLMKHNPCIGGCPRRPADYDTFWERYDKRPGWSLKRYGTLSNKKLIVRAKRMVSKFLGR